MSSVARGMSLTPTVVRQLQAAGQKLQKKDASAIMQESIQHIKDHKDQCYDIHFILTSGMVPIIMSQIRRETLPASSTHLDACSQNIKKAAIKECTGWDQSFLKKMARANPKNVDDVFLYMVDKNGSDPVESHYVDEFMEWVKKANADAGNRLQQLTFDENGNPNWGGSGLMYLGVKLGEDSFTSPGEPMPIGAAFYTHALHRFLKVAVELPKDEVDDEWWFSDNRTIDKVTLTDAECHVLSVSGRLQRQSKATFDQLNRAQPSKERKTKKENAKELHELLTQPVTPEKVPPPAAATGGEGAGAASSGNGGGKGAQKRKSVFATPPPKPKAKAKAKAEA